MSDPLEKTLTEVRRQIAMVRSARRFFDDADTNRIEDKWVAIEQEVLDAQKALQEGTRR